jgi:hypothetical protein
MRKTDEKIIDPSLTHIREDDDDDLGRDSVEVDDLHPAAIVNSVFSKQEFLSQPAPKLIM